MERIGIRKPRGNPPHPASVVLLRTELATFVACDHRLVGGARAAVLAVAGPGAAA